MLKYFRGARTYQDILRGAKTYQSTSKAPAISKVWNHCPRETYLACHPSPLWNLPSFTVKSTISSLVKVRLSLTFILSHLAIGCSGQTTLFLLLAKTALAYLHQQVCHFSSSLDSCHLVFYFVFPLPQSLRQIWQELSSLSSCSIRLQWVTGHSFLPGNNEGNELPRRGALLVPPAIPCSLSPLVSRILLFPFRIGGVLSHRNSSTHRFPRSLLRNLCSFITLAVLSIVFPATDTVYC